MNEAVDLSKIDREKFRQFNVGGMVRVWATDDAAISHIEGQLLDLNDGYLLLRNAWQFDKQLGRRPRHIGNFQVAIADGLMAAPFDVDPRPEDYRERAILDAHMALKWTTKAPRAPGWYWVMDADTPIAVQLGIVGDGTIDGVNEWTKDGYTGPYAGPIEPPNTTEGK